MLIESQDHKRIRGNIDGKPFDVVFVDGKAEVEEAVGEFLLRLRSAKKAPEPIPPVVKPEEPAVAAKSPTDMGIVELKTYAADKGVSLAGARTKAEILARLEGGGE